MNTRHFNKITSRALAYIALLGLCACSSGGSDNTSGGRGNPSSVPGTLSIGITDAPVNNAQEVWVQVTGASIQPNGGSAIDFTFANVKNIDLLSLQGTLFTNLIQNEVIPLGKYNGIRLHVNASKDNVYDSYIKLDDGSIHELWIPSGGQTGLKINTKFELLGSETLNLMIDFDLRKSITEKNGDYKLRPTLRMAKTKNSGTIIGTIDPSRIIAPSCTDADPATGNAVYLFKGADKIPEDMRNGNAGPFTSANVELNNSTGDYEYVIGFVPKGKYTLAFTCQADQDDPDINENIVFGLPENVTVVADQTTPLPYPVR